MRGHTKALFGGLNVQRLPIEVTVCPGILRTKFGRPTPLCEMPKRGLAESRRTAKARAGHSQHMRAWEDSNLQPLG